VSLINSRHDDGNPMWVCRIGTLLDFANQFWRKKKDIWWDMSYLIPSGLLEKYERERFS
jgi:hypothetical protein